MLRSVALRNRIVVSPMCQYASVDGAPTDWHLVHLGKFAIGGAGLVFGEETAIDPLGRKTYECAGIWKDQHVAPYRRITDFIRQNGAVPAIQLGHAGIRASSHGAMKNWIALTPENTTPDQPPWTVAGPSRPGDSPHWPRIREMTPGDIQASLATWKEATLRALDAGFDVLEIHGAHGYLIHEFLSPVTNLRKDGYGGDRASRMRYALEVTETVRSAWPAHLPLFFRLSAVDGKGGVWNVDDSVALAHCLKERGVDVIDVSSGGVSGPSDMPLVPRVPGYQVGYASRIRNEAGVQTMAVGLITTAQQAEQILHAGQADLIAMARELMWDPQWPSRAALELIGDEGFELLPEAYGYRLKRREAEARMAHNQPGTISQG
ncbi:MAG TPA: NADH:flavin oxidoreductase/NADH oxidase [Bordetella sp.]